LFFLAIVPAARAQQQWIAEGKLINGTDPSIIARGVEVEILSLDVGMSIIKAGSTDSSGKFRFEGLPPNRRMMVRANYKDANYHAQLSFTAGKANTDVTVYEPTTSMAGIEVQEAFLAFQQSGEDLKLLETVTFNNKTNPPMTFVAPEGTFRTSKSPGLLEPPQMRVTAPGSSMPVVQSVLESADGTNYYTLYPLRPGETTFEVQQLLPYKDRSYRLIKKFYQNVGSLNIGVIPQDMVLSGEGLSKIQSDGEKNFSIYRTPSIKAGTEIAWEFSGGTPVPDAAEEPTGGSEIQAIPNDVGESAIMIGSLLLMGFVLVLWYAFNRSPEAAVGQADARTRTLKEQREQLLKSLAELDHRKDTESIGQDEYLKQREEGKRRLRRISLLLKE